MTYEDYLKEAKEKKRIIYHAPLPMKKQRVSSYRYERNGAVKHYTKEEIQCLEQSNLGLVRSWK